MNFKLNKDKILIYFISISILVEAINGLFFEDGSETFFAGGCYRSLLIVVSSACIIKYDKYLTMFIVFYWGLFALAFITHWLSYGAGTDELVVIVKQSLMVTMLFASNVLVKNKYINGEVPRCIIIYSGLFIVMVFVFSKMFSLGAYTYEGITGYKALFNSVNTITFVLIILMISTFKFFIQSHRIKFFFIALLEFICLSVIGTKSGVLMSLFGCLLLVILNNKKNRNLGFALSMKYIYASVIFVVAIGLAIGVFFDHLFALYNRQLEFLDKSVDIFSYLISGRNFTLLLAVDGFLDEIDFLNLFFGIGIDKMYSFSYKAIEMDLFEIFFQWGFIGVCMTYGISLWFVIKTIYDRKYDTNQRVFLFVLYTIIIVYSILGGHVFSEPFSETYVVVALNAPLALKDDMYDEKISDITLR